MFKDMGHLGLGSHADERSRSRAATELGFGAEQDVRGERGPGDGGGNELVLQ